MSESMNDTRKHGESKQSSGEDPECSDVDIKFFTCCKTISGFQ